MQSRFLQIKEWLEVLFPKEEPTLIPIIGDASFRQYYRVEIQAKSYVVMDAPLDREKPDAFFRVARLLRYFNLNAPQCYAYHQEGGFLLLDDFGDIQFYDVLYKVPSHSLSFYQDVLTLIPKFWQIEKSLFPNYEKTKFKSELDVMKIWFWQWLALDEQTLKQLERPYEKLQKMLVDYAIIQPTVFVYRDFHSKNIMYMDKKLGLIDFQDAVNGPITYDLVSILKDCYVSLPQSFIDEALASFYYQAKRDKRLAEEVSYATFIKWFDWMGLQRHLKCLGIFTRQDLQHKRENYLIYLPRVILYVNEVLVKYPELNFFYEDWQRYVLPVYYEKVVALSNRVINPIKFDDTNSILTY